MARIVSQLLSLCAVVLTLSLLARKIHLDKYDPYRCHALSNGGRWLGQPQDQHRSLQLQQWQPPGCMLHQYNAQEIDKCLECNSILFAGDSHLRQLFWAMALKANKTQAEHSKLFADKHADLNFESGCAKFQFLWDPYLNSSVLQDAIVASGITRRKDLLQRNGSQTTVIVGGGLWHARYLGDGYLAAFQKDIGKIFNLSQNGDIPKPISLVESQKQLRLFLPVLSPNYDMLDDDRIVTLTRDRLSNLNAYLRQASVGKHVEILWSFSSMLRPDILAYEENGIHLLQEVVEKQADIVLNLRCNAVPALQNYPFDKTCCTDTRPYSKVHVIIFVLALSAIAIGAATGISTLTGLRSSKLQRHEQIRALVILSLACIYCYLADRTHLFEKIQKTMDKETFLWMIGFVMVAGALTMGPSTTANRTSGKDSSIYKHCTSYLSRDQTDEWKGWMQFVILLYHYFGMSKVLWVYQLVRLMVASYLFMTGFGHAAFFLKSNDFSLRRVTAVLMRLNILSVALAYGMRTDYNFYYFPAISSFWFLVVYLILRFWSGRIVGELLMGVSLLLLQVAIHRPGLLETVVGCLQSSLRMHIDVHELRFRISLDMYIVYVGMLFAIGQAKLMGQSPLSPSSPTQQRRSRRQLLQSIAVLVASFTIVSYILLAAQFSDKYAYNKWHSVTSPFTVLAYVALRNATPLFRTYHSSLFAWLGRCSLESFTLQYHIWLAADTKGLLRLGLCRNGIWNGLCERWCQWLEFWIITVFFLWTSWGVSKAINVLTEWFVRPAEQQAALGEAAGKREGPTSPLTMSMIRKLGLQCRLAIIVTVLISANWMWE
jgi:hypothetical protein